jgi:hypothetical protein
MTSLKIGSSVSRPSTTFRPAVERAATPARAEARTVSLAQRDEFVKGGNTRSNALAADTFEPQGVAAQQQGALPRSLEPFREALDNIAQQLTPELLTNPAKLAQFVFNALKELGIAAKDFMDAFRYVTGPIAQNTGKERLA